MPAELLRVNPINPEREVLRYAAGFLSRGSVIAIPTDTFYGLATDPFNLAAVDEIYHVKGRPEARALPILVNSIEQAVALSRGTPGSFMRLAHKFWPGALTLVGKYAMIGGVGLSMALFGTILTYYSAHHVLETETLAGLNWSVLVVNAAHKIPLKVTAGTGRVALRWPRSEVVRCLIEEFEGPVTGTSANISGFSSCASAAQVMKQLGSRVPLVLDAGETGATLPSTIVELNGDAWRIGREGAIAVEEIERAMKERG